MSVLRIWSMQPNPRFAEPVLPKQIEALEAELAMFRRSARTRLANRHRGSCHRP